MSSDLAELLAQIQTGDEAALLALYEQYANLVYDAVGEPQLKLQADQNGWYEFRNAELRCTSSARA